MRALKLALAANAAFFVVEILAGLAFGSLALLADAVHMATDVVALAVAWIAQRVSTRPSSARHTYGLLRAEVLAAQANAVVLAAVSIWVVAEAIGRFAEPEPIDGLGVVVVGAIGLAVNAVSAWWIERSAGESLNMRGAFLHLASDAVGSLGVVLAGAVYLASGAAWIDPAVSLLIAVLVLVGAWQLLRDATRVLLEGAPRGIDVGAVEAALAAGDRVKAVHHLHVWSIGSETPALSAHLVLDGEWTLHDAQDHCARLKAVLAERFGITHATLEIECHACDGQDAAATATDCSPQR